MANEAIYGKALYGISIYGDQYGTSEYPNNYIDGLPVGCKIRGAFGKKYIFRIRQGNGYAGSKVGVDYQDKFQYFVPSTITHPNGDHARNTFKNGMQAWANLSIEEKKLYNEIAHSHGFLYGVNLFLSEYMKRNY